MTSKGLMLGAEYRMVPDIHSKGIWKIDYLFDQQTESQSLYSDNADMSRENRNRWWARGKFDGYVGEPDWNLKFDLDVVSDQDYLREFSRGYSGFKKVGGIFCNILVATLKTATATCASTAHF
jgi:LPS-assembly protein